MEGENFESTTVESQSVETSGSYEESSSSSYESSEGYSYDSGSDGDYSSDEGSREGSYEGESGTIASATSDEGTSFELYTDPVTGKREFRVTSSTETEEGSPAQESDEGYYQYSDNQGLSGDVNNAVDTNTAEKPKYDLEEFSYALANGQVDGDRVPDEYQKQYADFRIAQAREAYAQRAQEEALQRQQIEQQMQTQNSPEAKVQANQEFYEALEVEASKMAMQDLGLTMEDLEDAEYSDDGGEALKAKLDTARNWHKQQLMSQLQGRYQQEQAYQARQKQLYAEIGEFTRQQQASEPHFAEIDKMLATAWQDMPTKYGSVVQGALQSLARGTITPQETQVIQKYYEDTRKLYYARRNGMNGTAKPQAKRRPPMVERAGNGQARTSDGAPNYAALRNADARGKKAWLANYFKNIEL